jgi:hypothetical protein
MSQHTTVPTSNLNTLFPFLSKPIPPGLVDYADHTTDIAHMTHISLGNIAMVVGIEHALKCLPALDWSEDTIRRKVVALLTRWILRAFPLIDDAEVLTDIDDLVRWSNRQSGLNFQTRIHEWNEQILGMPEATDRTSNEIVIVYLRLLMNMTRPHRGTQSFRFTDGCAMAAVDISLELVADAHDDTSEQHQQLLDLLDIFP